MRTLTAEEADVVLSAEVWRDMSTVERAVLQLSQEHFCMPQEIYRSAVSSILGIEVTDATLEKCRWKIGAHHRGNKDLTLSWLVALLPADKRSVFGDLGVEAGRCDSHVCFGDVCFPDTLDRYWCGLAAGHNGMHAASVTQMETGKLVISWEFSK